MPAGGDSAKKERGLCLRGTFIHFNDADTSLSPRAQSEPAGSVCASPRFTFEEQYIKSLGKGRGIQCSSQSNPNPDPSQGHDARPLGKAVPDRLAEQLTSGAPPGDNHMPYARPQAGAPSRALGGARTNGVKAPLAPAMAGNHRPEVTAQPRGTVAREPFREYQSQGLERNLHPRSAAPVAFGQLQGQGGGNLGSGWAQGERRMGSHPSVPARPWQCQVQSGGHYLGPGPAQAEHRMGAQPSIPARGRPSNTGRRPWTGDGQGHPRTPSSVASAPQFTGPGPRNPARTDVWFDARSEDAYSDARSEARSEAHSDRRVQRPVDGMAKFHGSVQQNFLIQKMHQTAQQMMSEGWGNEQSLSTALAVIEDIPMRVGEGMQKVASHIVDDMQSKFASISMQICSCGMVPNVDKVTRTLQAVPPMVHNLLEARVQQAKAIVQHSVHGMTKVLTDMQGESIHEQLYSQVQLISAEAEKIAGQALEAAAKECCEHAVRQLNFAISMLEEPLRSRLEHVRLDLAATQLPALETAGHGGLFKQLAEEIWPHAGAAEACAVRYPPSRAAGSHQGAAQLHHSLTNTVVANELLRAKVQRNAGDAAGAAPGEALVQAENPGSVGHPNLCPRPCIYFSMGGCPDGNSCTFCHMPHPKRPVRLDKRHREALKNMPFGKVVGTLLPLLRSKAESLSKQSALPVAAAGQPAAPGGHYDDVVALLDGLRSSVVRPEEADAPASPANKHSRPGSACGSAVSETSRASTQKRDCIFGALEVMSLRSILSMLRRLAPPEAEEERGILDQVLQRLTRTGPLDAMSSVALSESAASLGGSSAAPRAKQAQPAA